MPHHGRHARRASARKPLQAVAGLEQRGAPRCNWVPAYAGTTVANADHLFDRGFIGFEDNGDVLVSPVAHAASLIKRGVQVTQALNVGRFSEGQRRYLRFHREGVLLRSKYLEGEGR